MPMFVRVLLANIGLEAAKVEMIWEEMSLYGD